MTSRKRSHEFSLESETPEPGSREHSLPERSVLLGRLQRTLRAGRTALFAIPVKLLSRSSPQRPVKVGSRFHVHLSRTEHLQDYLVGNQSFRLLFFLGVSLFLVLVLLGSVYGLRNVLEKRRFSTVVTGILPKRRHRGDQILPPPVIIKNEDPSAPRHSHPHPVETTPGEKFRVALLSVGTRKSFRKLSASLLQKLCYASLHNYSTVFELVNRSKHHRICDGRRALDPWRRVAAIRKHLREYDWVMLSDPDLVFRDEYLSLDYLLRDSHHVVILDSPSAFHSASAILIRNSPEGADFVKLWAAQSRTCNGGCWAYRDSGGLNNALLHLLSKYRRRGDEEPYNDECEIAGKCEIEKALKGCVRQQTRRLGFGYGRRPNPIVLFWRGDLVSNSNSTRVPFFGMERYSALTARTHMPDECKGVRLPDFVE
mmetsp:Transcript_22865/g.37635  ORF Transcript_22865/g.37635 Transcript_22865/m.37635 type:complete len:427 (+) Transcript_22865:109-1389(+)